MGVDISGLTGVNASGGVTVTSPGSTPLGGTFTLSFGNATTPPLYVFASASDVAVALLTLPTVGAVTVSRNASSGTGGVVWSVTFSGCRVLEFAPPAPAGEVCTSHAVPLLGVNTSGLSGAAAFPYSGAWEVVRGTSPTSATYGSTQVAADAAVAAPSSTTTTSNDIYSFTITGLRTGTPYYVRVSAHTSSSFGPPGLPTPLALRPAFQPPAPPGAPTLLSSTASSLTLTWTPPRRSGGTPVSGYLLEVNTWAGGGGGGDGGKVPGSVDGVEGGPPGPWRVVYDGTGAPGVTTITVGSPFVSSAAATPGEGAAYYTFRVLARNAAGTSFSSPQGVYTPRAPSAPFPPGAPSRDEGVTQRGVEGTANPSAVIGVTWLPPLDNGGAAITGYTLSRDDGGSGVAIAAVTADTLEVQLLTFSLPAGVNGTLTVAFRGWSSSDPIDTAAFTSPAAAAASVAAVLEGVPTIGAVAVTAGMTLLPAPLNTTVWTFSITFLGVPGDVELLTLTPGSLSAAYTSVSELVGGGGTPLQLDVILTCTASPGCVDALPWQLVAAGAAGSTNGGASSPVFVGADGTGVLPFLSPSALGAALSASPLGGAAPNTGAFSVFPRIGSAAAR